MSRGTLILRRAVWAILMEQGKFVPLVNCTFAWGAVIATFLSILSIVPIAIVPVWPTFFNKN